MKTSIKNLTLGAISLLSCLASAPQLQATMIPYTATGGLVSGTLNGVSFTDAAWSITTTADTANITSTVFGPIPFFLLPTSATISIAGFGPANFTSPNFAIISADYSGVIAPGMGASGFAEVSGGSVLGFAVFGPGLYNDLASPISAPGQSHADPLTYPTSLGDLIITGSSGGPGMFGTPGVTVPEPSTLALGGLALAGLLIARRRQ